ncbi:MAG TPA: GAF domain-containing protein [Trichocoleus sp.]
MGTMPYLRQTAFQQIEQTLPPAVHPTASIAAAIQLLRQADADCLLVVDRQAHPPHLAGLLTEHDILRSLPLQTPLEQIEVQTLIRQAPVTLLETDARNVCLVLHQFQQHRLSHLPIVDAEGQVTAVITLEQLRDALELPSASSSRQIQPKIQPKIQPSDILNNAMASISCARVYADGTWHYEFYSEGTVQVFGYSAQDFLAEPTLWSSRILPEDYAAVILPGLEAVFAERSFTCEYRFFHADQHLRWISGRYRSQRDEASNCWIVTSVSADITERKQLESALRLQAQREYALNRVVQTIRSSLDLAAIFSTAIAEIGDLLHSQLTLVTQYSATSKTWQPVALHPANADLPDLAGLGFPDQSMPASPHPPQSNQATVRSQSPQSIASDPHSETWLTLPLHDEQRLWGAISVKRSLEQPWQTEEVTLLQSVTNQLTIAIQQCELHQQVHQLKTNLEKEIQDRTGELQMVVEFEAVLKRIVDRVRDSLDEAQILQAVVEELGIGLGVNSCNVSLYNLEQHVSTVCYEYNPPLIPLKGRVSLLSDYSEVYGQLLEGQCFQFCNLKPNPLRGQKAILVCPIADDQNVLGDLWLLSDRDYAYRDLEVRLVQQVANQCAIALRQSRLYQEVEAQVQELTRLNQLKDDFLSTVSHELRTPISNVKMAVQMLEISLQRAGVAQPQAESSLPPSPIDRYLQILRDECQREINLINDLLDLARLNVSTEPLLTTEVDVNRLISNLAQGSLERIARQQQHLKLELPDYLPLLSTDISYMERILSELLNNACKYTPSSEQIILGAKLQDQTLQIYVCNTGIEIPENERDRIFEKFYRIPQNDPWKHGGTGLGLALVKKLVEYLGATIHLDSSPNQTQFTIAFPLKNAANQTPVSSLAE